MGKRVAGPSVHRAIPPPHVKKAGAPSDLKSSSNKTAKVFMSKKESLWKLPEFSKHPSGNSQKVAKAARLGK